jgi:hypothetical protein
LVLQLAINLRRHNSKHHQHLMTQLHDRFLGLDPRLRTFINLHVSDHFQEDIMIDSIEEFPQIGVEHTNQTIGKMLADHSDGIVGASAFSGSSD